MQLTEMSSHLRSLVAASFVAICLDFAACVHWLPAVQKGWPSPRNPDSPSLARAASQ